MPRADLGAWSRRHGGARHAIEDGRRRGKATAEWSWLRQSHEAFAGPLTSQGVLPRIDGCGLGGQRCLPGATRNAIEQARCGVSLMEPPLSTKTAQGNKQGLRPECHRGGAYRPETNKARGREKVLPAPAYSALNQAELYLRAGDTSNRRLRCRSREARSLFGLYVHFHLVR